MVNSLQLVLRFPLLSLQFPANVQLVFALIIDITNFNFFSATKIIERY